MTAWLAGAGTALWLGILTSISPCPLTTNIAAVSYIARRVDRTRLAVASGLCYTLGRAAAYVLLGVILSLSVLSVPDLAFWLQEHMNRLLGPVLVAVGVLLLGVVPMPSFGGFGWMARLQSRADRMGVAGAGLLGMLFALSFCPTSAALFFGSLVPLTVTAGDAVTYPALYGLGTALPVLAFALAVAFGVGGVAGAFNRLARFEWWARRVTAAVFIAVGVYMISLYGIA